MPILGVLHLYNAGTMPYMVGAVGCVGVSEIYLLPGQRLPLYTYRTHHSICIQYPKPAFGMASSKLTQVNSS